MLKGITTAITKASLDTVVSNALKKYDDRLATLDYFTLSDNTNFEEMENQWIEEMYSYYDERAAAVTGKRPPANWREGNLSLLH